jgi:hypothetical protein
MIGFDHYGGIPSGSRMARAFSYYVVLSFQLKSKTDDWGLPNSRIPSGSRMARAFSYYVVLSSAEARALFVLRDFAEPEGVSRSCPAEGTAGVPLSNWFGHPRLVLEKLAKVLIDNKIQAEDWTDLFPRKPAVRFVRSGRTNSIEQAQFNRGCVPCQALVFRLAMVLPLVFRLAMVLPFMHLQPCGGPRGRRKRFRRSVAQ